MKSQKSKPLKITSLSKGFLLFLTLTQIGCGGGGSGNTNATPVADAGSDQDSSRLLAVALDASASSDADGDALSYTWTQIQGPDVTGGSGTLSGVAPTFQPDTVATYVFDLVVNDGAEDSAPDTVVINALENVNAAYFVDADGGSDDTGTGSRDNPFQSIAQALCEVTADQQDIYVMTRGADARYNETATETCPAGTAREGAEQLTVPTATSLYGGYDSDWRRGWQATIASPGDSHITNPTGVDVGHDGLRFQVIDADAWFSGFDIHGADSPDPGTSATAVSADNGGAATLYITDSVIVAGAVAPGAADVPGSSYGLRVALSAGADNTAFIERNIIVSRFGGDGQDVGNTFSQSAADGGDASGVTGGDGEPWDGGDGGDGAGFGPGSAVGSTGGRGQGPGGGLGGCGGGASAEFRFSCNGGGPDISGFQDGYPGADGPAARGDNSGGSGGSGSGGVSAARFQPARGDQGNSGIPGRGGGGGGGGEASALGVGGKGGGGGGGGAGGAGGPGGPGGGASIGVSIAATVTAKITGNVIDPGPGGAGAAGGRGQVGGFGGDGGIGKPSPSPALISGGSGGNGGSGGKGGNGGAGGGGGGGPSFGVLVAPGIAPVISGNMIGSARAGDGGDGGSGITIGGMGGDGGEGGYSYALFDADPNDGLVPQISNNTLSFSGGGEGGAAGAGGSIASAGDPGSANDKNW